MLRRRHILTLTGVVLAMVLSAAPTAAQETISADAYRDKLQGMWVGQLLGNYAGRPVEGDVVRGGLTYTVDWATVTATPYWYGDDDTCFEFLYADVLNETPDPTPAQISAEWVDHIKPDTFYIANKQARWLMTQGYQPPATGNHSYNYHWYAIDAQIATESIGGMTPGMRQRAAELTERFASVSNEGLAVHAAQFYAAMYATAAYESDVAAIINAGKAVVPTSSRSHEIIQYVQDLYAADMADGTPDWRATHALIYDQYRGTGAKGRYYGWVESTINLGMTTMALLYGEGDFTQTTEIAVLGGFDADCNPATAAGLIGMIDGYSGLPTDLTDGLTTTYEAISWLDNIDRLRSTDEIVDGLQSAAEAQILLAGGQITGEGAARTYHLPADTIAPPVDRPDPAGPAGLVGSILAAGGTVTTSASINRHDPTYDRMNLDAIIDGITDVTHNGHRAYLTYDGVNAQPAGGDFYQLTFDRDVLFESVVFYEGEYVLGGSPNAYPGDYEAQGGFFEDLTVEVFADGAWLPVTGLTLSEALNEFKFYQTITLSFDSILGDAVRIRGTAGGLWEYTSIIELEAYGLLPGPDFDGDGDVDADDVDALCANMGGESAIFDTDSDGDVDADDFVFHVETFLEFDTDGDGTPDGAGTFRGDFNLDGSVNGTDLSIMVGGFGGAVGFAGGNANCDGTVNGTDLSILAGDFGNIATAAIPEPATLSVLILGACLPLFRRKNEA